MFFNKKINLTKNQKGMFQFMKDFINDEPGYFTLIVISFFVTVIFLHLISSKHDQNLEAVKKLNTDYSHCVYSSGGNINKMIICQSLVGKPVDQYIMCILNADTTQQKHDCLALKMNIPQINVISGQE